MSMTAVQRLHHVEFLCREARTRALSFAKKYGFSALASSSDAIALSSGSTVFVFREREEKDYPVDTVETLALEVDDDHSAFDSACRAGATVISSPSISKDDKGCISSATVRTPFGNVQLKFVRNIDFAGAFLPGFSTAETEEAALQLELTSYCDHITFACPLGSLDEHVVWYEKCLGFRRCTVNRAENDEYGFVVGSELGNVGLRLKAMDYWRCSEIGVKQISKGGGEIGGGTGREVKLVFAEPLEALGANQVQTFLDDHGGPGIQHIGLHASDIISAASALQHQGVAFVQPPPEYYRQLRLGKNWPTSVVISRLQECNILLDVEEENGVEENTTCEARYLMQAFTQSLFSERTFFLELIHRAGALGFGAGNISALWRALQHHLDSKNSATATS